MVKHFASIQSRHLKKLRNKIWDNKEIKNILERFVPENS